MELDRVKPPNPYDHLPAVAQFTVTSQDVTDGQSLETTYLADGGNLSPQLSWSGAPEGTKSYVVTCFDPDAPTTSGCWHWVVVDIPVDVTELPRGAGSSDTTLPGGFHIGGDTGDESYQGAAPPPGDYPHRYFFVVHAIDVQTLGVDKSVRPAVVGFNLTFHTLGRAIITPTYSR